MRPAGWEARLTAVVEAARHRPFAWGLSDCAHFAADAVLAMTGEDHLGADRGLHRSARSARRRYAGAEGLARLVDDRLARIAPLRARRGDIVMVDGALGVCLGWPCALPGKRGLVFAPLSGAAAAWRVGK